MNRRRIRRNACRTTSGQLGDAAEIAALRYLQDRGLRLIIRNYRCRVGELDLVMHDKECLVVVEVRYRSGRFVAPALTVDRRKQCKLIRTTKLFLAANRSLAGQPVRFDVVAVLPATEVRGRIQWLRDAFRP